MTRTAAAVATLLVLVASSSAAAAAAAAAADSSRLQNATAELGPAVDSEFISIEFGGRTRDAVLYVPPSAPPGVALPLVFNYHGYGSDGLQQVFYSLNNPLADEEMFAVIYPDGIPSPRSHNGGSCCSPANDREVMLDFCPAIPLQASGAER
jgi:poly(3-hydroxybutyrate) depolymerase